MCSAGISVHANSQGLRMISARTRHLLVAAAILSGLLAGGNVDRAIVAMPAWEQVGAPAWAEFSRHADLANGLLLYPVEAIGGFLLILAATVSLHFDRAATGRTALPFYAAVLLSTGGLLCTLKAAPIMLSIGHLSDPVALQHALDDFNVWGDIRGAFQVLAFFAAVWALAGPGYQRMGGRCVGNSHGGD
jgi:hypothetical protein